MKINLHKNQGSISGGAEVNGHWLSFYLENDKSKIRMKFEKDDNLSAVGEIIIEKDTESQSVYYSDVDYLAEKDNS
jgi:hypothetical protein